MVGCGSWEQQFASLEMTPLAFHHPLYRSEWRLSLKIVTFSAGKRNRRRLY